MKDKLYGLDLFSGIGGNTLGLREHVKTVAYCEQDKHAQSVLLSRMADGSIESAPIWDDVSTLRGDMFDLPIDIIIAGFPCQDISVAGKGGGLEGQRSGLFFEIVRLAKEIKPTFLFLENVPAIRTRGLDRVIEELTEAGYDCRWCMLSASDVGARHKRERWFLLAKSTVANPGSQRRQQITSSTHGYESQDEGREKNQMYEPQCLREGRRDGALADTPSSAGRTVDSAGCPMGGPDNSVPSERAESAGGAPIGGSKGDPWPTESNLGGVANGIPANVVEGGFEYLDPSYWEEEPEVPRVTQEKEQRVERLKRLGNGVVPLQALTAFQFLLGLKDGTR